MSKTNAKPMVDLEKPSTVRRMYSVKEDVATIISEYAEFLSTLKGQRISTGDIISARCKSLERDPLFQEWLGKRGQKATKPAAIAKPQSKSGAAPIAQTKEVAANG